MAVEWSEDVYNEMYQIRIRDPEHPKFGQYEGYTRLGMSRAMGPHDDELTFFHNRRDHLLELFDIQPSDRILVIGAGFGFLIESFKDAGFQNIWGVDSSPYISKKKATEARGDVLLISDDVRGVGRVKQALKALTGDDRFNWVISESVVESYDAAEIRDLLLACRQYLHPQEPEDHVVHLVHTDPMVEPLVNRTIAECNEIEPKHSWVSLIDWEVM